MQLYYRWYAVFVDWLPDRPLRIRSIRRYLSKEGWRQLFEEIGIEQPQTKMVKGLYPFPFSLVFERKKQVIFRLLA